MRYLIAVFLLFPLFLFAQKDPCSKISRIADDVRGWEMYHTPFKGQVISLSRQFEENMDSSFISLTYSIRLDTEMEGFFLLFSDGSAIRDKKAQILSAPLTFIGETSYTSRLHINDTIRTYLQTKKIVKIGLGIITKDISEKTATNIPIWLKCLDNIRR